MGSVGEVLRLLSSGAAGAILLALGERPMQTKVLTNRVQGYTARTIYRYLPKLAELRVVERDDAPDGSARVVHTLNDSGGGELCELINRFAKASMTQLPNGQIAPQEWSSLGLLADLWEAGVVEELSRGPRSATELAQGLDALSYHQLNRRASRFKASGFLEVSRRSGSKRRCYLLTRKARRAMGLIAGIGRWRQSQLATEGENGLAATEVATILRAALPLATAPRHAGKKIRFQVRQAEGAGVDLCVNADADGSVSSVSSFVRGDAWAAGDVEDWLSVLLDGSPPDEADGDTQAVGDCLASLYEKLWTPSSF